MQEILFLQKAPSQIPGIIFRNWYLCYKSPAMKIISLHNHSIFQDNYLDEIKLKVDNINKQYLINSLYYAKKSGNVEGLYTAVWDKENKSIVSQNFAQLSDSIRIMAKTDGGSRFALNDFFIRDVILKKDGGFILTAEDHSTQSRGNPWNRYDYLYGYPSFSPYDLLPIFSFFLLVFRKARNYYGNNSQVRYYYENIVILNLDNTGQLYGAMWFISHSLMTTMIIFFLIVLC